MPQEPILEPGVVEPVHIVPATDPLGPPASVASYEPTQVIPAVAYQTVAPPVVAAPAPAVVPVGPGEIKRKYEKCWVEEEEGNRRLTREGSDRA